MMDSEILKPCPFCGTERPNADLYGGDRYSVWCWNCDAMVTASSEERAEEIWNTRVDNAELARLREENAKLSARYGVYGKRTDTEIE